MTTLNKLREEIMRIDSQIIYLLAERKKISIAIGKKKKVLGLPIISKERENILMKEYEQLSKQHSLEPEFIKSLFTLIHKKSRSLQKQH